MYNPCMAKRSNRTIYVLDVLMDKANSYGKRPDVDRATSRVIEYALIEYLRKKGVDLGPDFPDPDAT
jgi:hypothetical protein